MNSTCKLPDFSRRVPEKSEVFSDKDAWTYIKGCDYEKNADYPIAAVLIDRKFGVCGKRILELCSGFGALAYELWLLGAEEVVGLDASEVMVNYASKKYKNSSLKFVQASVYEIPFTDDKFDIVACQNSWHQLFYTDKALKEMVRVIRPGGHGIIIDYRRDADKQAYIERLKHTKPEIVPLLFDTYLASLTMQEFRDELSRIRGIKFSVEPAPDPLGLSPRVDKIIEEDPVKGHHLDFKLQILQTVEIYKLRCLNKSRRLKSSFKQI